MKNRTKSTIIHLSMKCSIGWTNAEEEVSLLLLQSSWLGSSSFPRVNVVGIDCEVVAFWDVVVAAVVVVVAVVVTFNCRVKNKSIPNTRIAHKCKSNVQPRWDGKCPKNKQQVAVPTPQIFQLAENLNQ